MTTFFRSRMYTFCGDDMSLTICTSYLDISTCEDHNRN